MFQRLLIFIILITSLTQANGQITLSPADLPAIGDVQISIKVDTIQAATLDPGPTGDNQLWDFSSLVPCCGIPGSQDTVKWMDPRGVDPGNNFPDATLATNTHCYTYHSHITHQDETVCFHNFYLKDEEGLKFSGTDYPVNATSGPPLLVQSLLSYGESNVNHSRMIFELSSDSLRTVSVIDSIFVDGWGSLATPIDTVNALRSRTAELSIDSLFVNGSLASVQVNQGRSWKWYTTGVRFPVLQIDEGSLSRNSTGRSAEYSMKSLNAVGIEETNLGKNDLTVFPNPFSQTVTFRFGKQFPSEKFDILFYDLTGKQVMKIANIVADEIKINRENLQPGIYLYRVFDAGSLYASGKVIIN